MKVQLAKVFVEDRNANGLLETKQDRMENSLGQPLSLQSKEVKDLANRLGISSLEKINLRQAAIYLSQWKSAREEMWGISKVEENIDMARKMAKYYGFGFDEGEAKLLFQQAYAIEARINFSDAEKLAKNGGVHFGYFGPRKSLLLSSPVSEVKNLLQTAQANAEKSGEAFDSERAYGIQLQAYSTGIEITFGRMDRMLAFGRLDLGIKEGMKELYAEVLQNAKEGDLVLDPERIQTIDKLVPLLFAEGIETSAKNYIEAPSRPFFGRPFPDDPSTTRLLVLDEPLHKAAVKLCQSVGVEMINLYPELFLLRAQSKAYQGDSPEIEDLIKSAEESAQLIGTSIDPERVKKIHLIALSKELVQLHVALAFPFKNGDVDKVQRVLGEIQSLAKVIQEKHGIDAGLSEEQKEAILKETYRNRLNLSWSFAPRLAVDPNLDELFKLTELIKADSEKLGITFDVKKFEATIKPGLLTRVENSYLAAKSVLLEKDCKQELEKTKLFAKEAGIRFDSIRAALILKEAKEREASPSVSW